MHPQSVAEPSAGRAHLDGALVLKARAPFRLDLTVWALRRRGRNRLDRWDGTYRRALDVGGRAVTVEVQQQGAADQPYVTATVLTPGEQTGAERSSIERQLVAMLGLAVDLEDFYDLAERDLRVGDLVNRMRGVKPPRFPTLFEAFVNAIANQQLSLEVGIELLNRFSEAFGQHPDDDLGLVAFPAPEAVLGRSVSELRSLGFSTRKAEYILSCADAVATGAIDEDELASASRDEATEILTGLRGIGRWSAEYVLLRSLGRTDVFPADDVGARNKLQRFFDLATPPDRERILTLLEPWHRFAGMIYFHLLLDGLVEKGELDV